MTATDLASAIGTWIAAFIAIVALVGVVGPILVWRASRTARYQAIAKLDAGDAENGGFVTKGIWAGKDIRLFRQIKAPLLRKVPQPPERQLQWNKDASVPSPESAGWVQLSASIRAFGLTYSLGDELAIANGRTFLPVSRAWLLLFGLIGRFGYRIDEGKAPVVKPRGIGFRKALPGQSIRLSGMPLAPRTARFDVDSDSDDYFPPSGGDHWPTRALSGVVGTFSAQDKVAELDANSIKYHNHSVQQIGDLSSEPLPLGSLFWLSVGCLPLWGDRVFSLEDPEEMSNVAYLEEPDERALRYRTDARQMHHDAMHGRYLHPHAPRGLYSALGRGRDRDRTSSPARPRMFRFSIGEDREESLVGIAGITNAEQETTEAMCMDEMPVKGDDLNLLLYDARRTYVPSERNWVRLGGQAERSQRYSNWFLERSDAQALACALLKLPLCPQGYLIQRPPRSACRQLLVGASADLDRLLTVLIFHVEHLQLTEADNVRLRSTMVALRQRLEQSEYTRALASAVYELDGVLADIIEVEETAALFVKVLAITNKELRDLMMQSLRHLLDCLNSTVTVDMAAATVKFATLFGVVQKFYIDFDAVVEKPANVDRSRQIDIPYVQVLLLVLRAALRSTFLKTSLSSEPLYVTILSMSDIIQKA